jgi:hypothetical protein
MSVAEQDYHPFAIGMDSQTWNEAGTDSETVTFYAHYPKSCRRNRKYCVAYSS